MKLSRILIFTTLLSLTSACVEPEPPAPEIVIHPFGGENNDGITSNTLPESPSTCQSSDEINAVSQAPVVVFNSFVYVLTDDGNNGRLLALDRDDLSLQAEGPLMPTDTFFSTSGPGLGSDVVVVTRENLLIAHDAATLNELWREETTGRFLDGTPRVFNDQVMIGVSGQADTSIVSGYYGFNVDSGEQIWHYQTQGQTYAPSTLAVEGDRAYGVTHDNFDAPVNVVALDIDATGTYADPVNSFTIPNSEVAFGSVSVFNNLVYVNTSPFVGAGKLYGINVSGLTEAWNVDTVSTNSPPTRFGDLILVTQGNSFGTAYQVLGVNPTTEAVELTIPDIGGGKALPLIVGDQIIIATDNAAGPGLYILNRDGSIAHHYVDSDSNEPYPIQGPPAVADGVIYAAGSDGRLYACR